MTWPNLDAADWLISSARLPPAVDIHLHAPVTRRYLILAIIAELALGVLAIIGVLSLPVAIVGYATAAIGVIVVARCEYRGDPKSRKRAGICTQRRQLLSKRNDLQLRLESLRTAYETAVERENQSLDEEATRYRDAGAEEQRAVQLMLQEYDTLHARVCRERPEAVLPDGRLEAESWCRDRLARLRLADAQLPGISAELLEGLSDHGIVTAADIKDADLSRTADVRIRELQDRYSSMQTDFSREVQMKRVCLNKELTVLEGQKNEVEDSARGINQELWSLDAALQALSRLTFGDFLRFALSFRRG